VPQDPTLFNDSVMNNIRYSRLDASDQEVYEACKAAAIHDKIMSFPDGKCCQ
jgi:ABC-type multidrug transport system fused ATPase/permease subunit